jgi:hypothetical protein
LATIPVDHHAQIVDAVMRSSSGGLPRLAFLKLSIGHEAVDAGIALCQFGAHGHPQGNRQSIAKRSTAGFHARDLPGRGWVALQHGAQLAEGPQLVTVEVSLIGKDRIQDGAGMAIGQNEAIAVVPLRVARVVAQILVVQRCQ